MKTCLRRGAGERLVCCTWVIVFTVVVTSAEAAADALGLKEEIGVTQSQQNDFSSTDVAEATTLLAFANENQEDDPVNYVGAKVFTVRLIRKSHLRVIEEMVNKNRMFFFLSNFKCVFIYIVQLFSKSNWYMDGPKEQQEKERKEVWFYGDAFQYGESPEAIKWNKY